MKRDSTYLSPFVRSYIETALWSSNDSDGDYPNSRECTCESCAACDGTGHYFVDMHGQFSSIHRLDDMHDMETCEECGGTGIERTCDGCQDAIEGDSESLAV